MSDVFVVGSINQDFVLQVERRPEPGETVTDAQLSKGNGGKGANQAAAAALLGADVAFLGRVGDEVLRRWFRTARVYVSMSSHEACGITLLEGLAAGAGVVAADIPAYRELATRAGPGAVALTPLDTTPAALARAIRASAARTHNTMLVANVPSWDAVAARTMLIYRAAACPTL